MVGARAARSRRTAGVRGDSWRARTLDADTTPDPLRAVRLRRLFGEFRGGRLLTAVLIGILLLLVIRPVAASLLSYHRTDALLDQRRAEVADLRERNAALKARNDYYHTDLFLEERARAYGMVRPGEQGFVIRDLVGAERTDELR